MKNLKFALLLLILVFSYLSFAPTAYGDDREIGGYVDRAEDRFVRNVWNFIKNFQGFQNIGSHRYREVQYYWGEPFEFDSDHQDFVDKMDLAYVAAHGSAYYVQTNQSAGEGVDLRNCPAYGDLPNGGDLEFTARPANHACLIKAIRLAQWIANCATHCHTALRLTMRSNAKLRDAIAVVLK